VQLTPVVGEELAAGVLNAPQIQEFELRAQRIRVAELKTRLLRIESEAAAICSPWWTISCAEASGSSARRLGL